MEITHECPFGETRCLCQTCTKNAAYEECTDGFCINCFECEHAGKQIHDLWFCTGHESTLIEEEES